MEPLDLAPIRLEAARNLGINVEFRLKWGREFTGSRYDYQDLTQAQQLRLSEEMGKILKRKKAAAPEAFSTSQAAAIEKLAAPPPLEPSTLKAMGEGALEGLVSLPSNVKKGTQWVVRGAGETVGIAYEGITGESVGSTVTRIALIAAGAGLLYAVFISGAGQKMFGAASRKLGKKR